MKTNKEYTDNTILKLLRSTTKIDKITINMMRHSIHFYKDNLTYNQKKY